MRQWNQTLHNQNKTRNNEEFHRGVERHPKTTQNAQKQMVKGGFVSASQNSNARRVSCVSHSSGAGADNISTRYNKILLVEYSGTYPRGDREMYPEILTRTHCKWGIVRMALGSTNLCRELRWSKTACWQGIHPELPQKNTRHSKGVCVVSQKNGTKVATKKHLKG